MYTMPSINHRKESLTPIIHIVFFVGLSRECDETHTKVWQPIIALSTSINPYIPIIHDLNGNRDRTLASFRGVPIHIALTDDILIICGFYRFICELSSQNTLKCAQHYWHLRLLSNSPPIKILFKYRFQSIFRSNDIIVVHIKLKEDQIIR